MYVLPAFAGVLEKLAPGNLRYVKKAFHCLSRICGGLEQFEISRFTRFFLGLPNGQKHIMSCASHTSTLVMEQSDTSKNSSPFHIYCKSRSQHHHAQIHPAAQYTSRHSYEHAPILSLNGKNASDPQCNIRHLIQPCHVSLPCKYFRFLCESFLPHTISKSSIYSSPYKHQWHCHVPHVKLYLKWQIQHFRTLAKEPVVCLLSCKSCTMYT